MAENKTVQEFAEYVVDNMWRATVANALNIADKLDTDGYYKLDEFVKAVEAYIGTEKALKFLGKVKASAMVIACYNCLKYYNSTFKYNKRMIIDNFIIDMWEASNLNG